jgi:molybdopterin converting factor small subunit
MARVTVQLPSLLAHAAGGASRIDASGESVAAVLDDLKNRHPILAVHVFDESGDFREHVLCFVNDTNTRWLSSLDCPVSDGDSLTVTQAVSGG